MPADRRTAHSTAESQLAAASADRVSMRFAESSGSSYSRRRGPRPAAVRRVRARHRRGRHRAGRFIADASVHDDLVGRPRTALDGIVHGAPRVPATTTVPLISGVQRDRVAAQVASAPADGGTVHAAADVPDRGYFHPAALVTDAARRRRSCGRRRSGRPSVSLRRPRTTKRSPSPTPRATG
ncbi:hypothetical protein DMH08_00370 [Actinomadura sp. WAC 06369]|nr:hypothetical protein DMH08_00370 [Actinomadura sp. WAC 06369]